MESVDCAKTEVREPHPSISAQMAMGVSLPGVRGSPKDFLRDQQHSGAPGDYSATHFALAIVPTPFQRTQTEDRGCLDVPTSVTMQSIQPGTFHAGEAGERKNSQCSTILEDGARFIA
jgi:hypothetical protein